MPNPTGRDPLLILKGTKVGELQQTTLNDIQKFTFIAKDKELIDNWKSQVMIKNAQLATKTFGYGLPGPHSLQVQATNTDATATILRPSANEVLMIDGISVKETEGSTAGGFLSLTDGSSESIIWVDTSISANQIDAVNWSGQLYLTYDVYLKWTNASGAVQIGVAYSKVVY